MLKRREFLKLSAMLAAGAVVTASTINTVLAVEYPTVPKTRLLRPALHLRGHARSGCSFRPELTDMWAGGGAVLPESW